MLCASIEHIHKLCKLFVHFLFFVAKKKEKMNRSRPKERVKPFCTFRAELSTAKEGKEKNPQKISALPAASL